MPTKTNSCLNRQLFIIASCLLALSLSAQTPALTKVHGKVIDAKTGEGLPYATIQLSREQESTRTDIDGNFYLETTKKPRQIRASYVGYENETVNINPGVVNELTIRMHDRAVDIKEITIKPKKYSVKNNPAVDLVEEVFRHKDQNRKEGLQYYSCDKYEKLQFDINGINDHFRNRWYLRKFQFIFDNVDTSRVNKKVALPLYLRERLMTTYYRKSPQSAKDYLRAEKQTVLGPDFNVDEDGVSEYLNNLYQDIDIYSPTISLLTTQFIGPLSGAANAFYRFYIVDTIEVEGKKYADVFFSPRNKLDLAFMGNMLVALDSTYAVLKVEMGVSKEINLNWVTDLHIEQEFAFAGNSPERRLLMTKEAVTMDFNIFKKPNGRSLQGHKTVDYKNYTLNKPLPDSLFKSALEIIRDTGNISRRSEDYWTTHRHQPLSKQEQGIGRTIDSIQHVRAFKVTIAVLRLLGTGYEKFGPVAVGPLATFYSFNDIEGLRLRAGGRTTTKFSQRVFLEGYGAYGFKDQRWKHNTAITYAFKGHSPRIFPMNQIYVGYLNEMRIPGVELDDIQPDNFLLSFQRGTNTKSTYTRVFKTEYTREYRKGWATMFTFQHRNIAPGGTLLFQSLSPNDLGRITKSSVTSAEAGFGLRFAPNEKFYQAATYRISMVTKHPVFYLTFRAGFKNFMGGEYNFQRLNFKAQKVFFIAPFGRTEWTFEAAKVFGKVPYPLLEMHRANQSYEFDWYAYNLMNFLEFASDHYVALTVHENLNGFLFNKIPLIKKLQWREVMCFKAVYGGLDARNQPSASNGLLLFPEDANGKILTHSLESKPYMEASVGIANILRVVRVDYIQRLSYTNLPNVSKWGIRLSVQALF
jgi:hypothetical protein